MSTHPYPPATLSRKLARAHTWDSVFLSTPANAFLAKGLHLIPLDEAHVLLAYGVTPSAIVVYGDDAEALAEVLDQYPGIKCINDSFAAAAETYRGKLQTCFFDAGKDFSVDGYEQFLEVALRLKPSGCASYFFVPNSPDMPEIEIIRARYMVSLKRLSLGKSMRVAGEDISRPNTMFTPKGQISTERASILYEHATMRLILRFMEMNKVACAHCLYLAAYRTLEGDPGLGLVMHIDQRRPGESKSSFYRRRMDDAIQGALTSDGEEVDEDYFKETVLNYYNLIESHPESFKRVAQMFGIEDSTLEDYLFEHYLKEVHSLRRTCSKGNL